MDREQAWAAIGRQRRVLADLAADLTDDEWERPSLCAGWRVRDVVAHVALGPQTTLPQMIADTVRARGEFNRLVHDTAVRKAAEPTWELVTELREVADSRRRPPGVSYLDSLADVLVHTQDIAIPVGRSIAMPTDAAAAAAQRVWSFGFPHWARRRLRGLRLVATDTAWTRGEGIEVRGPIGALLLLLTGRTAALDALSGDGAAIVRTGTARSRRHDPPRTRPSDRSPSRSVPAPAPPREHR
ncbi:maleylpyruvate isomerase family mycothiol-dependent enzyme [Rhodococcus daqingensis]|uniref:Maleylpyruvate isomerase family mycothiol-dependent enzyme n=1 Tax=Rhodococcus daqingensis TaxID=2479363 RepID=A0ABW2S1S7_9NOCA